MLCPVSSLHLTLFRVQNKFPPWVNFGQVGGGVCFFCFVGFIFVAYHVASEWDCRKKREGLRAKPLGNNA